MEDCKTLDELIAALQDKREKLGGDTRVMIRWLDGAREFGVGEGATGKGQPFKLVTRGGVPVVLLY